MDGSPDLLQRYERLRQAGDTAAASAVLALARRLPGYRAQALVSEGLAALQAKQYSAAFLALAEASQRMPDEPTLVALLGRTALDQHQPALAQRLLDAAWVRHAGHPQLRTTQWLARMASQTPQRTVQQMHAAWRYMGAEERQFATQQLQRIGAPVPAETTAPQAATPPALLGPDAALAPVASPPPPAQAPRSAKAVPASSKPAARPVDILIPVYNGRDDVIACLRSVLRYTKANRTPHRVVVLDDASPDAGLAKALQDLAHTGRITLVRQPVNLGFIGNMNHGMALAPAHDVVWLNADTRVHGNWLDRLRAAAYASKATATATPLSNNGELLSFPRMRECADMPDDAELALLDSLAHDLPAKPLPLEVGCGFCFFIKRPALDAIGLLDGEHLQRGYGEETDWCLRSRAAGWQHVAATNVFVAHKGGVSFGDEKPLRVKHNNAVLRTRYPDAEARFHAFVRQDPLQHARQALQRARLKPLGAIIRRATPAGRQLLVADPRRRVLGLPPEPAPIRLVYHRHGWQGGLPATLQIEGHGLPLYLNYQLPADTARLAQDLRHLGVASIAFADAARAPEVLRTLPAALRLPESPYAAPACPTNLPAHAGAAPAAILIADTPGDPALAERWLTLARAWARSPDGAPQLLLPAGSPWSVALEATGIVRLMPQVEGLTQAHVLALSGCTAALSLEIAPDASWLAPFVAINAAIPLYAPASAQAAQAGAHPLDLLAPTAPWPLAA